MSPVRAAGSVDAAELGAPSVAWPLLDGVWGTSVGTPASGVPGGLLSSSVFDDHPVLSPLGKVLAKVGLITPAVHA